MKACYIPQSREIEGKEVGVWRVEEHPHRIRGREAEIGGFW